MSLGTKKSMTSPSAANKNKHSTKYPSCSFSAFLVVLILTFAAIAFLCSLLRGSRASILDLLSSLAAESNASAALRIRIDSAQRKLNYHSNCNRREANLTATRLTALAWDQDQYAVSTWNSSGSRTGLLFFSDELEMRKTCLVDSHGRSTSWKTHRLLRVGGDGEVVFYSQPSLFFIQIKDCFSRNITFGVANIGSLAETATAGEYLISYGGGNVYIGLINSAHTLLWSKEVDSYGMRVYQRDSSLIRLRVERFALLYQQDRGKELGDRLCLAIIDIGTSHANPKLTKTCFTSMRHGFGLAETDVGGLLVLGVGEDWSLVLAEIDPARLEFPAAIRLVLGKVSNYSRDAGETYRISRTRFAFVADTVDHASALIYDYPSNRVTKSVRIPSRGQGVRSMLTRYGNDASVLTMYTETGFAALPTGDRTRDFVRRGADAGLPHMAATGDGGYLVASGENGDEGNLRISRFYPWQEAAAAIDRGN